MLYVDKKGVINMGDIRGIIIDPDTGLQTGYIAEGDKIIRKASMDYLNNTDEWRIESFVKGHTAELKKWMDDLSSLDKAFLFSVAPYISYDDCHLQHLNGNDITTSDLIDVVSLDKTRLHQVINSLISKDILYKGKNSKNRQYFVNPWLFCKGNRINRVLKTMFKNYRIRVLGGVRWCDLKPDK